MPVAVPASWEYSRPWMEAEPPCVAVKDPSVVYHGGRWHVFMTARFPERTVTQYCSFDAWEHAQAAPRTVLAISGSSYYCAPQVFYFEPQRRWYLVCQAGVPGQRKMEVAYSTTATIEDPASWAPLKPILDGGPGDPRQEGGLDYWVICDSDRAYLFFTSLNGKLWRLWTPLAEFPAGFGHGEVALQGPFFEASHTYRLQGTGQYLTIVEQDGRRYYQAYLADRLDGPWRALANTADRPFAGAANIRPAPGVEAWTDNVSHGELVREGCDQTLTVDPANLRFVFQGMLEKDKAGKRYGQFPWRIGLLTPGR